MNICLQFKWKKIFQCIVLCSYRFRKNNENSEAVCGDMTKYYYDNHGLKLILDLLAESHGATTCLRVLALFDSEFNEELVVPGIIFPCMPKFKGVNNIEEMRNDTERNVQCYDLHVKFQDAPSKAGILEFMNVKTFSYIISLHPPTKSTSSFKIMAKKKYNHTGEGMEKSPQEYFCMLEDLDISKEYVIRIDTNLNGKVLGNRREYFGPIRYKLH